ncbi:hypothetical protein FKW77_003536 [Venturia effusa]|uniref:Uncharacterized protein n=1 Tax=Venturia effusa TaxID=50376 RepID=A0A517KZA1_9PEZI|nr:hypothetical protein FKW77_003536 [Venturia effusa]
MYCNRPQTSSSSNAQALRTLKFSELSSSPNSQALRTLSRSSDSQALRTLKVFGLSSSPNSQALRTLKVFGLSSSPNSQAFRTASKKRHYDSIIIMHFTSYLAALLLTLAPATLAGKKKCKQLMVSYAVSCENDPCDIGYHDVGIWDNSFIKAKRRMNSWFGAPAVGGTCGVHCLPTYRAKPKRKEGLTYYLDCFGARIAMNNYVIQEFPAPPEGLEVAFFDTSCNVHCDNKSERSCDFTYDAC